MGFVESTAMLRSSSGRFGEILRNHFGPTCTPGFQSPILTINLAPLEFILVRQWRTKVPSRANAWRVERRALRQDDEWLRRCDDNGRLPGPIRICGRAAYYQRH